MTYSHPESEHEHKRDAAQSASTEAITSEVLSALAPVPLRVPVRGIPYGTADRAPAPLARLRRATDVPALPILRRYPTRASGATIAPFAGQHKIGNDQDNAKKQTTPEQLTEIANGVVLLTDTHEEKMVTNCIGWAIDAEGDQGTHTLWQWGGSVRGGVAEVVLPKGDKRADIVLWGRAHEKNFESSEVLHASVRLTRAQLAERSRTWKGMTPFTAAQLEEAGVPDPCWSSAGGMGFAIMVHPRDFYAGGIYGGELGGALHGADPT